MCGCFENKMTYNIVLIWCIARGFLLCNLWIFVDWSQLAHLALNLSSFVSIFLCIHSFWGCKWGGNCYAFICNPTMSSSWPTPAYNILHVFQYEVVLFYVCMFAMQSLAFAPPFVTLCLIVHNLFRVDHNLHLPARSLSKSHQPLHQCKAALRPAKGKLHRPHGLLSRYKNNLSRGNFSTLWLI